MAKKRTRMDELKDVIYYGPQKARAKWEIDDGMEELSRWCAWLNHLDEVYAWTVKNPNGNFWGMRELIEECPNKGVRDFFNGLLDEWNQMRAEQLPLVAEDYYDSRMGILLGQADALVGGYDGVQTLLDILEWYMTR